MWAKLRLIIHLVRIMMTFFFICTLFDKILLHLTTNSQHFRIFALQNIIVIMKSKHILSLIICLLLPLGASAQEWSYDFESASKDGFDESPVHQEVTFNDIPWITYSARRSADAYDFKNGKTSARFYGEKMSMKEMPRMEMSADKPGGIGTVSFVYRAYENHSYSQVAWIVQVSQDEGQHWEKIGDAFTPTMTVETFRADVYVPKGRIRIVREDYQTYDVTTAKTFASAFNLDDIKITNYLDAQPIDPSDDGDYSGGSGTANDPYLLSSPSDIEKLAIAVNEKTGYSEAHFKLANDIDMSGVKTMIPIGTNFGEDGSNLRAFSGTFDGDGHTVSHLNMTYHGKNYIGVALFGILKDATVKNLTITDSHFEADAVVSAMAAVLINAHLENCHVGEGVSVKASVQPYAGGLACSAFVEPSDIVECSNKAEVYGANMAAAGILCVNSIAGTTIKRCINYGDIRTYDNYGAGIVSFVEEGNIVISDCANVGTVTANDFAAGFVSIMQPGTAVMITNSYDAGHLNCSSDLKSPVIISEVLAQGVSAYIENCYYCPDHFSGEVYNSKGFTFEEMATDAFVDCLNNGRTESVWRRIEGINDELPVPFGEGSVVAVPNVSNTADSPTLFDLSGRRITTPRGLYIKGGRVYWR